MKFQSVSPYQGTTSEETRKQRTQQYVPAWVWFGHRFVFITDCTGASPPRVTPPRPEMAHFGSVLSRF